MDYRFRICTFLVGLFIQVVALGQQLPSNTEDPGASIRITGMHIPADILGNLNNRARIEWQADTELSAAIALFHDTYGPFSERVRVEVLMKRSMGNGMYLFTGGAIESEMNPNALSRGSNIGWMGGAGFAPNKNLSVEAGFMISVTRPQIGYFGSLSQKNGPFLGARFRY